ncbi:YqcI/YcgG family protein [Nonomuraea sp. CA-218870]|uniref:YqcI/YcgG family protein n=1 Tax=Nonomuraea sp. CA-218870 TaxID=3239998 RepID=UPI003D92F80E
MDDAQNSGFSWVIENTLCPFARSARVAYCPPWDSTRPFPENLESTAQALTRLVGRVVSERLHGIVIEIHHGRVPLTFASVRGAFCDFMRGLAAYDVSGVNCMDGDLSHPDWQFEFGGQRMFTSVFAPCYDEHHPKHTPRPGVFYVFFQPEISFDFCHVHPGNSKVRQFIRAAFSAAGRPYDGALIDRRVEAHIYMFPRRLGDAPVRWWDGAMPG